MILPRFSIVIPSYNGGDYLKACVRAALAQRHDGFEVVVLEDASTDGSLEWLQSLNDARLKIYSSPRNLGIVGNWARFQEIERGEFMTIVGQDDWLDPHYLSVMDELIARHPDASLYHAHFRFVDERGQLIRPARTLPERESAAEYATELFSGARDTHGCGYMMRSRDYDAVGGIPRWERLLFADDALWMLLMRLSYKATAAAETFACRRHLQSTGHRAAPLSWLRGLSQYVPFLQEMARGDAAFEAALQQHAPAYFSNWGGCLYAKALVDATKQGRVVDAEIAGLLLPLLAQITPGLDQRLQQSRAIRMRRLINSFAPARELYNLYILARYGEWRARPVRNSVARRRHEQQFAAR